MFHAMVFAIYRCGFRSRCALEARDSSEQRVKKIEKIIGECPIGIHDISRTEPDKANNLPRFNMPFELGLFLGARAFGASKQKKKACLVLDREPYRYQKFLSDIAGQDISSHDDKIERLIDAVRNFLNAQLPKRPLPASSVIQADYLRFQDRLPELCAEAELDEAELEYIDYAWLAADYVSEDNPPVQ